MSSSVKSSFRDTMIGSGCVALGQLLFATNDSMVKFCGLKESQLLFGRFFIQLVIAVVWWLVATPKTCTHWYGDKPYIVNVWIRGFSYSISMVTGYYAYIRLPIGDATTIYYQSPLVITIIAHIFLKESLPKTTPIIVVLGSIGICFISQPSFLMTFLTDIGSQDAEPLNMDGVLAMIVTLFTWSISVVLVRRAKQSHFIQLEIVSAGQTVFFSIPLLMTVNQFAIHNEIIGEWHFNEWYFDVRSMVILLLLGIFGFVALSLNVIGFQYGDATRVGWLEYIIIIFSFCYQVFLFNDIPNPYEVIGVLFVFISCCVIIGEEMYYHYINDTGSDALNERYNDSRHLLSAVDTTDSEI